MLTNDGNNNYVFKEYFNLNDHYLRLSFQENEDIHIVSYNTSLLNGIKFETLIKSEEISKKTDNINSRQLFDLILKKIEENKYEIKSDENCLSLILLETKDLIQQNKDIVITVPKNKSHITTEYEKVLSNEINKLREENKIIKNDINDLKNMIKLLNCVKDNNNINISNNINNNKKTLNNEIKNIPKNNSKNKLKNNPKNNNIKKPAKNPSIPQPKGDENNNINNNNNKNIINNIKNINNSINNNIRNNNLTLSKLSNLNYLNYPQVELSPNSNMLRCQFLQRYRS